MSNPALFPAEERKDAVLKRLANAMKHGAKCWFHQEANHKPNRCPVCHR